jgi:hypothetical protein
MYIWNAPEAACQDPRRYIEIQLFFVRNEIGYADKFNWPIIPRKNEANAQKPRSISIVSDLDLENIHGVNVAAVMRLKQDSKSWTWQFPPLTNSNAISSVQAIGLVIRAEVAQFWRSYISSQKFQLSHKQGCPTPTL